MSHQANLPYIPEQKARLRELDCIAAGPADEPPYQATAADADPQVPSGSRLPARANQTVQPVNS